MVDVRGLQVCMGRDEDGFNLTVGLFNKSFAKLFKHGLFDTGAILFYV